MMVEQSEKIAAMQQAIIAGSWATARQILTELLASGAALQDTYIVKEDGPHKGISVLWLLAYHTHWDLFDQLFEKLINQGDVDAKSLNVFLEDGVIVTPTDVSKMLDEDFSMPLDHMTDELIEASHVMMKWEACKGTPLLWVLAENGRWDSFRQLFDKLIDREDVRAESINAVCELDGWYELGVSVLWLLAKSKCWDLFERLFEKLINQEGVDAEGLNADGGLDTRKVLWFLAQNARWNLFEQLFDKLISQDVNAKTINAVCEDEDESVEDEGEGTSVLWLLAFYERWDLFEPLFEKLINQGYVDAKSLNAVAKNGEYKDTSVLHLLADGKRWDLFETLFEKLINQEGVDAERLNGGGGLYTRTVLWFLAKNVRWDLFEPLFEKLINQEGVDAERLNGGGGLDTRTVLWFLAKNVRWHLFGQLFEKLINQEGVDAKRLNAVAKNGEYKDTSVLDLLADGNGWDLFRPLFEKLISQKGVDAKILNVVAKNGQHKDTFVLYFLANYELWDWFDRLYEKLIKQGDVNVKFITIVLALVPPANILPIARKLNNTGFNLSAALTGLANKPILMALLQFPEDIMQAIISGYDRNDQFIKYKCCFTQELILYPVTKEDGFTYEKASIEKWLQSKDMSPLNKDKKLDKNMPDISQIIMMNIVEYINSEGNRLLVRQEKLNAERLALELDASAPEKNGYRLNTDTVTWNYQSSKRTKELEDGDATDGAMDVKRQPQTLTP